MLGNVASSPPTPPAAERLGHAPAVASPRTENRAAAILNAVSVVATALAALFAGWAAFETRTGVRETARATQTSVLLQVLTEYAAPDMLSSMRGLRTWQQRYGAAFADTFRLRLLRGRLPAADSTALALVDADRRRVGNFFQKIQLLAERGAVNEQLLAGVWGGSLKTFVVQVLVPMENAKSDALFASRSISQQDQLVGRQEQEALIRFFQRLEARAGAR